jgi:alkylation response protein AidB-like acyl-CoA dehydrogenase
MLSFEPTQDQVMMRDLGRQFARSTLLPRQREFEAMRGIPEDVRRTAHEMGFSVAALPEAIGGAGLGMTTAVLLEEELASGDAAAPFALGGPGALGLALWELATPELAREILAPFVGPEGHSRFGAVAWGEKRAAEAHAGLATAAAREGGAWIIDGEKAYIANADRADTFLVFAQTDPARGFEGIDAFVVPRTASGLRVLPREATLGIDAASFGGLSLDGVRVSEVSRLGAVTPESIVRFFARHALLVAARGVGLARAAFDVTRDYCETRKAFGKPIGHFQAVAFNLADRAMDVEASRQMVWRAASALDAASSDEATREALLRTANAVAFVHEAAMRGGDDGVQLHGGSGFMRDCPVEKLMRDAKQLQLCGLSAEHADQLAAAIELGRPVDPALVLPSADSQSCFV